MDRKQNVLIRVEYSYLRESGSERSEITQTDVLCPLRRHDTGKITEPDRIRTKIDLRKKFCFKLAGRRLGSSARRVHFS